MRFTVEANRIKGRDHIQGPIAAYGRAGGLYNHQAFYSKLEVIAGSARNSGRAFLAVIDIDNFKNINDTYGHLAGDMVLRRVVSILQEDMGTGDFAVRYGGEEFTVVLTKHRIGSVPGSLFKAGVVREAGRSPLQSEEFREKSSRGPAGSFLVCGIIFLPPQSDTSTRII